MSAVAPSMPRSLSRRTLVPLGAGQLPLSVRMRGDPAVSGRKLRWWYWLATGCLLATSLAGWREGLWLTMAFVAAQLAHLVAREGSGRAFPVQTRIAYLVLLAAGTAPPLAFVHWLQLAGTCGSVFLDYCVLARIVSLMPWNRTRPLTIELIRRTFLSPPVRGSVLHAFAS